MGIAHDILGLPYCYKPDRQAKVCPLNTIY